MGFSLCVYLSSQPASQNQLLMFRYFNLRISYEPVYVISLMFWFWIWTSLMVNFLRLLLWTKYRQIGVQSRVMSMRPDLDYYDLSQDDDPKFDICLTPQGQ